MEPSLSLASTADIPQLATLLASLFTQEAEFVPARERQERGLAAIIGHPDIGQVLVARQGGECVGMVVLLYTVSTALGEPVAWLEDLVVDPAERGRGIGTALVDLALKTARKHGCRRISLLTDGDNAKAQALYRRKGFTRSGMVPFRCLL